MLQAASLAALPGIRHAFFTRDGGVSDGIYASLNGGPGSGDAPAKVAENRARMAAALGVDRLLTAYQIHSPDVVTIERPWDPPGASARRRPRDPDAGDRHRRHHRRLRPGPARGRRGRRHRRRPCRLARRRDRRAGSYHRGHGTVRRRSCPHGGGARADDPPAELRGRPGIRRPVQSGGCRKRAILSSPRRAPGHALFDLPGYIAARLTAAGLSRVEDLGHCTYADAARFFSYRRSTHRNEGDYGRHINAIALVN